MNSLDSIDSIELCSEIIDELQSLANLKKVDIDDYVMNVLEEDVLRKICFKLVSDSCLY